MILYSFVADHFQYLASIGLIALAVSLGATAFDRPAKRAAAVTTKLRSGIPVLLLAVLVGLCWSHGRIYRNQETLWRDTLAKNPDAVMADVNLSVLYMAQGRLEESRALLENAIRVDPAVVHPVVRARAYGNLGVNLGYLGRPEEAIPQYQRALSIDPTNLNARFGLALACEALGRLDDAIQNYQIVLNAQPDFAGARAGLDRALAKKQVLGPVIGR
jgi:tetratricopeptide (TPR) repeat protein